MYAIIETGGKQVKVEVGQTIYVEKLEANAEETFVFDKVFLVSDGKVKVGNPLIKGATVTGTILKQGKSKKLVVYKYKAKHNERVTHGHRQPYTAVKIDSINL